MEAKRHLISTETAITIAENLYQNNTFHHQYDHEKHTLLITGKDEALEIQLRLPIHYKFSHPDAIVNYLIVLVQTENSAIGYFEGTENIDHKAFSSYGVRKKQGKSQIKYLKTRGKSKAGSRVRLGNTTNFFEKINTRLQDHFNDYEIERIAFSCSKILLPFLFKASVPCPFDKKDERIFKIPRHIHTANYEELLNVHKFLQKGELIYSEEQQTFAEQILDLGNS
ncbi:hypothetical protein V6R21_16165 [Limibacter armeniacum]|uniref:hypothetical protein n=1 Tax=Limibacter armeniacum TaxID=466084 RepID=UPI002FE554A1